MDKKDIRKLRQTALDKLLKYPNVARYFESINLSWLVLSVLLLCFGLFVDTRYSFDLDLFARMGSIVTIAAVILESKVRARREALKRLASYVNQLGMDALNEIKQNRGRAAHWHNWIGLQIVSNNINWPDDPFLVERLVGPWIEHNPTNTFSEMDSLALIDIPESKKLIFTDRLWICTAIAGTLVWGWGDLVLNV